MHCRVGEGHGLTKSSYAREVIHECQDELDDLDLPLERLKDIRSGRANPVSFGDDMRVFGMER